MSYPRKSRIFQEWAKAMVAGATVDKPSYPGTSKTQNKFHMKRRKRRRKKRKNATKES